MIYQMICLIGLSLDPDLSPIKMLFLKFVLHLIHDGQIS